MNPLRLRSAARESTQVLGYLNTSLRFFLMASIVTLGVLYVSRVSSMATKGYDITELERDIRIAEYDLGQIEYDIAMNRSLPALRARLSSSSLVFADQPTYIRMTDELANNSAAR